MDAWALAGIAVLLMGYAAVSGRLASTPVTQAMVFVAVGLLVGNQALDVIDVDAADQFVRHLAEATLALVLFTDAVRVNLRRLRREAAGPGPPARHRAAADDRGRTAGRPAGLAPDLELWTAAALATILAPTDAALGLPVVSNRRLPSRIRQGLNVESGLNDGVCVPLLIIFLTLAEAEEDAGAPGAATGDRSRRSASAPWPGSSPASSGPGCCAAFAARGWMHRTWQQINAVATPLLAYTAGRSRSAAAASSPRSSPGSSSAPSAGAQAEPTTGFAEQSGELLNALTFLMFGAVLLGPALGDLDWRVVAYAVLSLTVVRMLPVALAMIGMGMRRITVAFLGWFGPRGPGLDRVRAAAGGGRPTCPRGR